MYTNAQSIVNKIDELRSVACSLKPDIILINESWTNKDITNAYLNIQGYELSARKDRTDTTAGRGGGLLVYSRCGMVVTEKELSSLFNQAITVSVETQTKPLLINLVYRSPNSSAENNAQLDEFIKLATSTSVTLGDMNYRGIDWENGCSDSEGRNFFNATQDAFLQQHVDFPTHDGNTLDLVLSTNDIQVQSVEDGGNLGKSHHSILLAKVISNPTRLPSTEQIPDYAKADFSKLRDCMSIDWNSEFRGVGAQDGWTIFKNRLSKSMEDCIPLKTRRSDNKPLWMNQNIMRLIRKKRRLWNWYKTTKDYAEYQAYLEVQKAVAKVIRAAKRKFERKLAKNFKKNPRQFYSHLNTHTKSRSQVGPLQNEQGTQVSDSQGLCNILNTFFSSVFTNEDTTNIPVPQQMCDANISSFVVTEEMFKKRLSKVKKNGAPGPNKITQQVLSELQDVVALPLCIIFNKSLSTGEVPEDWKIANVTPVFKKGNRSLAANYRPISLTSIVCKILESLICEVMVTHLTEHKALRASQHGFVSHRSSLTNLLEYLETVTTLLDQGHNVDVFYLDFSKAFDRVPHQRLLAKLKAHGISGDIFNWIEAWLSGRKQRVVLNGSQSDWTPVPSGVPQGSVLGPLLFVIFINDIDTAVDVVHCWLLKFADDTKGIHKVDNDDDAAQLQKDLDNLYKWSCEWQMLFNLDKCHVLHFGSTNSRNTYTINNHQLLHVDEEKDLGVIISSSCTPRRQVSAAAMKGNQVLGQLLRAFTYRDRHTFIRLYQQYVRPHLEYCIQAWSPWLQQDIDLLENVQRRAVRSVSGLTGSYEEKLKQLNMYSLKDRRTRGDMIETYKIVQGIEDVEPSTFFSISSSHHDHATRQAVQVSEDGSTNSPSYGLLKGPSRLELRANFFSQRVVNTWNSLPSSAKNALSVNAFKNNYDKL